MSKVINAQDRFRPSLSDAAGFDLAKKVNNGLNLTWKEPCSYKEVVEEGDRQKELAYRTAVSFLDYHLEVMENHYKGTDKEVTAKVIANYLRGSARKEILEMMGI